LGLEGKRKGEAEASPFFFNFGGHQGDEDRQILSAIFQGEVITAGVGK
jgi:hypothetical protein